MRYSIMLQLVAGTTAILVGTAALFAWIQNRPQTVDRSRAENQSRSHLPLSC